MMRKLIKLIKGIVLLVVCLTVIKMYYAVAYFPDYRSVSNPKVESTYENASPDGRYLAQEVFIKGNDTVIVIHDLNNDKLVAAFYAYRFPFYSDVGDFRFTWYCLEDTKPEDYYCDGFSWDFSTETHWINLPASSWYRLHAFLFTTFRDVHHKPSIRVTKLDKYESSVFDCQKGKKTTVDQQGEYGCYGRKNHIRLWGDIVDFCIYLARSTKKSLFS